LVKPSLPSSPVPTINMQIRSSLRPVPMRPSCWASLFLWTAATQRN